LNSHPPRLALARSGGKALLISRQINEKRRPVDISGLPGAGQRGRVAYLRGVGAAPHLFAPANVFGFSAKRLLLPSSLARPPFRFLTEAPATPTLGVLRLYVSASPFQRKSG